jgi:hypothetical protein
MTQVFMILDYINVAVLTFYNAIKLLNIFTYKLSLFPILILPISPNVLKEMESTT